MVVKFILKPVYHFKMKDAEYPFRLKKKKTKFISYLVTSRLMKINTHDVVNK